MSNCTEKSTEYVEGREEFDEAAKRLLGVDVFLEILGAGLDRRDICREVAQRAFTFGLLVSPTQEDDLMLLRHVANRVWDGPGDTGFDESEEWQSHPRRLTTTPPINWTPCTHTPTQQEPECAFHPRWSVHASCSRNERKCHFHPSPKAEGLSLKSYMGHEPLSRAVYDALRDEVGRYEWAQSSADRSVYSTAEAKERLQGYLQALVQVGCISANHPLCLLTS